MQRNFWGFLALSLGLTGTLAAAPLPSGPATNKLARTARFDLQAQAAAGLLSRVEVLGGGGQVGSLDWLPAGQRERGCTVSFPVVHFAWTECVLRFVAEHDGTVQLKLMGPWEEAAPGLLFKQEIAWDKVEATGSTLANGGFEELRGNIPTGWEAQGGVANSGPLTPLAGRNYARTWHNKTLTTTLPVKGGQQVSLRLHARALPPPGFQDMRRPLLQQQSAAFKQAEAFRRGANLGNYLEVPPGQTWQVPHDAADFRKIKAQGFDHVRIPIGWHHYTGPAPEYRLKPEIFATVDAAVQAARSQQLGVLINLHHFNEFYRQPQAETPRFKAIWQQVAQQYAGQPPTVGFELLNEPMDQATTRLMSELYGETIKLIRLTNPVRPIFVGPGQWNSIAELSHLNLPFEDDQLIVTVHCYDPFFFTHQGASWAGAAVKPLKNIVFPGPPATAVPVDEGAGWTPEVRRWLQQYNERPAAENPSSALAFRFRLDLARQWGQYYARPIHVGEFGAYTRADPVSRARFYKEFRETAESFGLGWAIWDWKSGFNYWDPKAEAPLPGMAEALFGSK